MRQQQRPGLVTRLRARARTVAQQVEKSVILACLAAGGLGLLLLIAVAFAKGLKMLPELLVIVAEHAGSALIVACFMGFTYEAFLHYVRGKTEAQKAAQALAQIAPLLPKTVFALLADIARLSEKTPTLFPPARNHMQESVFMKNPTPLRQLLDLTALKSEEQDVLEEWVAPDSHKNLKFLASDLVGLCRWRGFAPRLSEIADRALAAWETVPLEDKGWLLNYKWAASMCDDAPYEALRAVLVKTDDDFVREWLLFLPHQMRDEEIGDMISGFLADRGSVLSPDILQLALVAFGELDKAYPQEANIADHEQLFMIAGLSSELARIRLEISRRSGAERRRARRDGVDRRISTQLPSLASNSH